MSNDKINIATFLTLSLEDQVGNGREFGDKQIPGTCGVWYDWFCTNKALVRRGKSLVSKLKSIQHSKRFDPLTTYTFFKNNCPLHGELYDDFRICDIATGDVVFTVVPKSGHTGKHSLGEIWGRNEDGSFGEQFTGTWLEIKNWFNSYHIHNPRYGRDKYVRVEKEVA